MLVPRGLRLRFLRRHKYQLPSIIPPNLGQPWIPHSLDLSTPCRNSLCLQGLDQVQMSPVWRHTIICLTTLSYFSKNFQHAFRRQPDPTNKPYLLMPHDPHSCAVSDLPHMVHHPFRLLHPKESQYFPTSIDILLYLY